MNNRAEKNKKWKKKRFNENGRNERKLSRNVRCS